ncbi:MAG: gamma-glutamyl-gamma-aminobutyrate hydrolase family protein [Chloroflexaceae bacterium]|jgi:putative glutamine amidotransferase|nr:gamma-glutamyl-gamma-aminobutyrate hydrolase family protein [Chloroflexaceae bacterium]
MKPVIGISCGSFHDKAWCPPIFGHRQTYVNAVVDAGGVPLLIPSLEDERVLRVLYDRLDGLLLAGGGDIQPSYYGEQPHERLGNIDPLRDQTEMPLARWAVAEGKPLLGICRGVQVMNVALGGSLYQDIPTQVKTTLEHDESYTREDWTYMAHAIRIEEDSKLASFLGTELMSTNSLHHQAVKAIAPGLRPVAWAPDGIIEGLEGTTEHFLVGVQCHPEALQKHADPRWQALFRAFVKECVAWQHGVLA